MSGRALLRTKGCALALAFATGCSGTVVSGSDASTTTTQALLSVERSVEAGEGAGAPRTYASAHFLRLQAGADESIAARLVGADLSLPEVGQCEPMEALQNRAIPLASLGPVDLVDVGEVSLEADEVRATLAARAFPDVVDLVSGVVYTTRDQFAAPLPEGGRYVFRVAGSGAIAPLTLAATAPGGLEQLRVDGLALDTVPLSLPRGDISISWQATGDDLVYVDLSSNDDGSLERVRCTLPEGGMATIAASALPHSTSQTIWVHKVRREALTGPGLDGGEVRFDMATTGGLKFEVPAP
jgi:hypothetical protein